VEYKLTMLSGQATWPVPGSHQSHVAILNCFWDKEAKGTRLTADTTWCHQPHWTFDSNDWKSGYFN